MLRLRPCLRSNVLNMVPSQLPHTMAAAIDRHALVAHLMSPPPSRLRSPDQPTRLLPSSCTIIACVTSRNTRKRRLYRRGRERSPTAALAGYRRSGFVPKPFFDQSAGDGIAARHEERAILGHVLG